ALIKMFEMYCTGKLVKCYHYILWYGLILRENGNIEQSNSMFNIVLDFGYENWRIKWYKAQNLFVLNKYEESKQLVDQVLLKYPEFQEAQLLLKQINKRIKNKISI